MNIKCYRCKRKLIKQGALLFAPPVVNLLDEEIGMTKKYHLCSECYLIITAELINKHHEK